MDNAIVYNKPQSQGCLRHQKASHVNYIVFDHLRQYRILIRKKINFIISKTFQAMPIKFAVEIVRLNIYIIFASLIIIINNFNRRSSHGHHGSKCCELAHSRGSHTFTHTLTSTTLCQAPAHLLQNLESKQKFKLAEGGEANQRKTPTACPLTRV